MTRFEWLRELILKEGFETVAEVGLNNCITMNCLLETGKLTYYLGVDICSNKSITEAFAKYDKIATFSLGDSTDIGNAVDRQFDLVFVDADHSYQKVLQDIAAWEDKVRPGGILCGDDYDNPHWPGVKQAVDEYFAKFPEIELHTIGSPTHVWWVRK
jgi:SAM-dependent methyltransferase